MAAQFPITAGYLCDAMILGNEAPQVSIQAAYVAEGTVPKEDHAEVLSNSNAVLSHSNCFQWLEILPKVDLGPNSRHLFKIPATTSVNYVKINMYPDGGIVGLHANPPFLVADDFIDSFRLVSECMD